MENRSYHTRIGRINLNHIMFRFPTLASYARSCFLSGQIDDLFDMLMALETDEGLFKWN